MCVDDGKRLKSWEPRLCPAAAMDIPMDNEAWRQTGANAFLAGIPVAKLAHIDDRLRSNIPLQPESPPQRIGEHA